MTERVPVVAIGSPPAGADDFKIYSSPPNVRFLTRGVQPPSAIYVMSDDDIVAVTSSVFSSDPVTVSYRLLRFDGVIILGQFQVASTTPGGFGVHQEDLAEGFLLSVSCKATVSDQRGQTFVRLFLTNPSLGNGQPSYMLMADYVTTKMAPAHPNGRLLSPVEGPGWFTALLQSAPGAGTDVVFNLVLPFRIRVLSISTNLITDATPGNRTVAVNMSGTLADTYFAFAYQGIPPSTNALISAGAAVGNSAIGNGLAFIPIPDNFIILGGGRITISNPGGAPADQFGQMHIYVEQWIANA